MFRFLATLTAAVAVTCAGCNRAEDDPARSSGDTDAGQGRAAATESTPLREIFADATSQMNVDFVHQAANAEKYFMPSTVGSGAALFDYDNDGRLDLLLLQNAGPDAPAKHRLYRLTDGMKYVDVSEGSGLDLAGYGMGAAAGDFNNDGRVDLFLTEYGRVRLFRNDSTGAEPLFTEITSPAGIENAFWGTSTAFVDFDRDGWLDLVIVNYVNYDPSRWCADDGSRQEFCGPDAFPGRIAKLYRNLGAEANGERFEDVTIASGLASQPGPGLGILCADFDGDAWPDLFVANDGQPNHLWINQRKGKFAEEGVLRGIALNAMGKAEANMGIAVGDVNGDGLFDLFVTHLTEETHTLWRQEPRGFFLDHTAASKLIGSSSRSTGFGTVMADVDNDGDLDLMLANGRVTRAKKDPANAEAVPDPFWRPYAEPNQLLLNDGVGNFVNASPQNPALCGAPAVSRGLAVADLDDDGGIDVVVTRVAQSPIVCRNIDAQRGHWLLVRAIDPRLHRDAYGAELTVKTGEKSYHRLVNPGYSFLCSNDPRAHFGLASADKYDAIEVLWPDGMKESFPGGPADRLITLERGAGKPAE